MRHLIVLLVLLCGLVEMTYSQDTTTARRKQPRLMAIPFFGSQVYAPGGDNRFGMTYRFSTGVHTSLRLGKRTTAMVGGTFANNFALGKYALTSRSFAQGFFHGAIGATYTVVATHKQSLAVGPVWARLSYFPGETSPVPRGVTNPFTEFSKEVRDSLPGLRGNYYNGLYLYTEWRKTFSKKQKIAVEGNILFPFQFKEPLHSWQPRGALVHIIRLKAKYEFKQETLLIDAALPSISQKRNAYASVAPTHMTGRVEYGHSFKLSGGAIKAVLGYERDWHALNFPSLLKRDAYRGTWSALYVGVRFEGMLLSKK